MKDIKRKLAFNEKNRRVLTFAWKKIIKNSLCIIEKNQTVIPGISKMILNNAHQISIESKLTSY